MNNPIVKSRFHPYKNQVDNLKLTKMHTVEFFYAGTGGLEQYTDGYMLAVHTSMNISEEEFVAFKRCAPWRQSVE